MLFFLISIFFSLLCASIYSYQLRWFPTFLTQHRTYSRSAAVSGSPIFNGMAAFAKKTEVEVEFSEDAPVAPLRGMEWAKARGLEPGFGGYWPGDPNAPTHKVSFVSNTTGEIIALLDVPRDRYIFFYFEEMGLDLPIINKQRMCRQGCCTVCTGKVIGDIVPQLHAIYNPLHDLPYVFSSCGCSYTEGKVKMDSPLGLLKDMRKQGYILTCTSYPRSDLTIVLQDEDEMYVKQWGESFEGGGVEWGGFLPDDD